MPIFYCVDTMYCSNSESRHAVSLTCPPSSLSLSLFAAADSFLASFHASIRVLLVGADPFVSFFCVVLVAAAAVRLAGAGKASAMTVLVIKLTSKKRNK